MTARRVVCLHGLGRTPSDWDGVRPMLAGFGEVLAPRIPTRAADALNSLDAAITPGSIVIGHSMGGVLAMRLAAARPRPLRAVVLTDCFFVPARNGRSTAATIADYGAHRVAFLRQLRRERAAPAGRGSLMPLLSLIRQALLPTDLESALTAVTRSVLVVHAANDHHVPIDFAIAAAHRHPAWDLHTLSDGGHHAHVSRADQWSDAVGQWLSGTRDRTDPAGTVGSAFTR
jgi:pimeloyl-ACP methyl ester carboxylesterase